MTAGHEVLTAGHEVWTAGHRAQSPIDEEAVDGEPADEDDCGDPLTRERAAMKPDVDALADPESLVSIEDRKAFTDPTVDGIPDETVLLRGCASGACCRPRRSRRPIPMFPSREGVHLEGLRAAMAQSARRTVPSATSLLSY